MTAGVSGISIQDKGQDGVIQVRPVQINVQCKKCGNYTYIFKYRKEINCRKCGKKITLPEEESLKVCSYCGNNRFYSEVKPDDIYCSEKCVNAMRLGQLYGVSAIFFFFSFGILWFTYAFPPYGIFAIIILLPPPLFFLGLTFLLLSIYSTYYRLTNPPLKKQ